MPPSLNKRNLVDLAADVRQEGQVTSAFNRDSQRALVPGAGASLAAGSDFALFGDETAEHIYLLVVDGDILVHTELADFGSGYITSKGGPLVVHHHIIVHQTISKKIMELLFCKISSEAHILQKNWHTIFK
jgi:hypothetical protein